MNRLVRMEKRMFKFSLDDLTLVGLQKIAGYYGIPTANIPRITSAQKLLTEGEGRGGGEQVSAKG